MLQTVIKLNQDKLIAATKKANLGYLAVFGSQSRGDATSSSDIDLLFDYSSSQIPTLFSLGLFRESVVSILGQDVDLVSRRALNPRLKPLIQAELKTIYEENG